MKRLLVSPCRQSLYDISAVRVFCRPLHDRFRAAVRDYLLHDECQCHKVALQRSVGGLDSRCPCGFPSFFPPICLLFFSISYVTCFLVESYLSHKILGRTRPDALRCRPEHGSMLTNCREASSSSRNNMSCKKPTHAPLPTNSREQ